MNRDMALEGEGNMNIRFTVILLVTGLIINIQPLSAQSSLSIRSADSTAFYLFLSGSRINESPKALVSSDSIPSGKIPVDILLSDSVTSLSYTLELTAGFAYVFELFQVGKEYQLLRFSQSSTSTLIPGEPGADSGRDSSFIPGYLGPKGCAEPVGESEFNRFLADLREEYFESRRLSSALAFTGKNCITVSQLARILSVLDLEDRKLELVSKSLNGIYDQGHFMNLRESFRMESSAAELEKLQRQLPRQN